MIRYEMVTVRSGPGFSESVVYALDDRIVIDEYFPKFPGIVWSCDNCEAEHPVTAQFKIPGEPSEENPQFITLCRVCLQNAINGIDASLANPQEADP